MVSGCDVCGDRSLAYCEGCGHHYLDWVMVLTFVLAPIWVPLVMWYAMTHP